MIDGLFTFSVILSFVLFGTALVFILEAIPYKDTTVLHALLRFIDLDRKEDA